jgi:hypothetical protein
MSTGSVIWTSTEYLPSSLVVAVAVTPCASLSSIVEFAIGAPVAAVPLNVNDCGPFDVELLLLLPPHAMRKPITHTNATCK